jgi:Domain of unknown function (DUF929)
MRRRQRVRRLTITLTVAVIIVSLVVGFYFALNSGNGSLDKYIGVEVSPTDASSLYALAHAEYGPSGASFLTSVKNGTGPLYTASNGKPILVYIGAEFCQYCAAERWPLVISLMRFGNFTGLEYMTSAAGEGDYATFTLSNITYASPYLVFQPFEHETRAQGTILTPVPANYSSPWQSARSGYPFLNFRNQYIVAGSLVADPSILAGKNWTQVMSSIRAGDALGTEVKGVANAITALICKITDNSPASVCNQSPIPSETFSIASYSPQPSSVSLLTTYSVPASSGRRVL